MDRVSIHNKTGGTPRTKRSGVMGVVQKRKMESGKRVLLNLREMVHAKAQRKTGMMLD